MLNIFISLTLLVQIIVALLLILVVLMQRPKQEGLGAAFGAGMTDQMFGAQTTNVLQKATVWFGITFFSTTLLLAILYNKKNTAEAISTNSPVAEEVSKIEGKTEDNTPSLAEQLTQAEKEATPLDSASDDISQIKDNAKSAPQQLELEPNIISEETIKQNEAVKEPALDTTIKIKDNVESGIESIQETATNTVDKLKETVGSGIKSTEEAASTAAGNAKETAQKGLETIEEATTKALDEIKGATKSVVPPKE